VIACILQRAQHINSAGGYLRALTEKARVGGDFCAGKLANSEACPIFCLTDGTDGETMETVEKNPVRTGHSVTLGDETLILRFMDKSGAIATERVADSFGMSKTQLAETVGLARESLYKAARNRTPKTQARIKEMLEIISRVTEWAGGKEQAMAWYRAQPIPAFGGRTAEALVKEGKAGAVRDYLDHLALGGFA
jgi:uncharacterized protein (DUF2384 family)